MSEPAKRTTSLLNWEQAPSARLCHPQEDHFIPLMAAELFGVKVLGRLMGVVLTADGVAEATFPMLIGYSRDKSGSYRLGFVILIAIALLGALAVSRLSKVPAASDGL